MVLPNTEMKRADLLALITAANAAAAALKLKHGPFTVFNPADGGGGNYFQLLPPYVVTDRGAWTAAGTFNAGDQVSDGGYLFISVINGNTTKPLDAITGDPNGGWLQPWYSCYQRIRDETRAGLLAWQLGGQVNVFQESVSGPWPCQNPNINYDQLAFFYEDTGRNESVSIVGGPGGSVLGKFQIGSGELIWDGSTFASTGGASVFSLPGKSAFNPDGSQSSIATTWMDPDAAGDRRIIVSFINDMEWQIVVGGTEPVVLNGAFIIRATVIRGATFIYAEDAGGSLTSDVSVDTGTDPLGMLKIDTSAFIAGATFTLALNGSGPAGFPDLYDGITATCAMVNQTVNPGVYRVRATSSAIPDFSGTGVLNETADGVLSGNNIWSHKTYLDIGQGLELDIIESITRSSPVDAPGIDDVKQVKKIVVNNFGAAGGFGMQVLQNYGTFDGLETVPGYPIFAGALVAPGQPPSNRYFIPGYPDPGPGKFPAFSEPIYTKTAYLQAIGGIITTSTTGYWLGVTPPVNNLGMIPFDQMPWNQFPTTLPNTGANTATDNQYLGYTLPYVGGKSFTNTDSTPAYQLEQPTWLPGSDTAELQIWPKRWKPQTHYPLGFTIQDAYGNFQTLRAPAGRSGSAEPVWSPVLGKITKENDYLDLTGGNHPGAKWELTTLLRAGPSIQRSTAYTTGKIFVDDNGNLQRCTTAGATGANMPVWAKLPAATTADGTVIWTVARVNPKLNPAVARISPPIYPSFWQNPVSQWRANTKYAASDELSDANGNTQSTAAGGISGAVQPAAWSQVLGGITLDGTVSWKNIRLEQPPLTDPNIQPLSNGFHPFSFRPQGWWIYRVMLNRIPPKKSLEKPPAASIPVELGCIRNGVFVSFGTFHTGTPVDALWPVFTNTALAVRCSERLDVQAEILTCGLGYATWGTVSYPLAATHLNDLTSIIALL